MGTVKACVARFVKGEEGVSLLEYGLLAALIALVCVIAITTVGTAVSGKLTEASNGLTSAPATP